MTDINLEMKTLRLNIVIADSRCVCPMGQIF